MSDTAEIIRLETAEIRKLTQHLRVIFEQFIEREIECSASCYERKRDLPNLLAARHWENRTRAAIIIALQRAVVAERKALARDHWSADRNRLVALAGALRAEERGNV